MASRRRLTGEDLALWEEVARTARPLRPPVRPRPAVPAEPAPSDDAKSVPAVSAKQVARARPRHQQAPIDRRTARRIARGTIAIDGRIDLHGNDQANAHERLTRFLVAAQEKGWQLVLVITGKGVGDGERGVLRRVVPYWLSSGSLRGIVAGFDQAHRSHGGGGALYVRIRRRGERR